VSFPDTPTSHTDTPAVPLGHPSTWPVPAPQPPVQARPPRRVLIGFTIGLGVLVIALVGTVAAMAGRGGGSSGAPANASVTSTPAPSYSPAAPWSPPPPTDISVPFGETLVVTDSGGGEVRYVVTADKVYAKTKYGTKPEKGVLFGVKVAVEVISGSTYVCPCDFALIAKDGTAYEGSGFQVDGGLDALDVNRGQKTAGVVVFDVPDGTQAGGRIELREGGRSSENQGFWTIP
jgi:hypothetical protein